MLYFIEKGKTKNASGIAQYADGSSKNWYYVENGVYKKATGISKFAFDNKPNWYYVENGRYEKKSGIAQYADGDEPNNWYYVHNGKFRRDTGLTQRADQKSKNWYLVVNGEYYTDYTGLVPRIPDGKLFYVTDGIYDQSANGVWIYDTTLYNIKNGVAVSKAQPTAQQKKAAQRARVIAENEPIPWVTVVDYLLEEGYPLLDSYYGAGNCGIDWYEQAVRAAKELRAEYKYIKADEVYRQLQIIGFEPDEALYGVEHCGFY